MAETALLETTDSSSVCMRSVAAALRDEFFQPQDMPAWVGAAAGLLSGLGRRFNNWAVDLSQSMTGIPTDVVDCITTDDLARHALAFYRGVDGPFDVVIVGAPNGGVAHLATALQVPFLSQHLLTSFRDHKHADDIRTYAERGTTLAKKILTRNPDVAIVNHYDPLHDRFLVRWVNHIRYKLLDLPHAYQEQIRRWLRPGGTIIFIDCRYPWAQYRVGDRHTFQVGGLGGVTDQEFLTGRPEIETMQRREHSPYIGGWRLDLPLEVQPESEWGALAGLRQACAAFATANGYGFLPLTADHPEYFSALAFHAHLQVLAKEGRRPQAVLIDCFTQTNPVAARRSGLAPLWMPFNCTDSLAFLQRTLSEIPAALPVLMAPLPNFAPAFDTVSLDAWLQTLSGHQVQLMGINPRHYPEDLAGLFRFAPALRRWCDEHATPVRAVLTLEELCELAGPGFSGSMESTA